MVSDRKLIWKLYPVSKTEIQPILIICPPSNTCSNKTCQGQAILQLSDPNELVITTLLKVFRGVVVLSGKCSECKMLELDYVICHMVSRLTNLVMSWSQG